MPKVLTTRIPWLVPALAGALLAPARAQPVLTPETLFEQVSPSVWVVRTQDSAGKPLALGSAVVIGPGRLITNCHVLARAKTVSVARENVSYGATLEFPDAERDLCQLKVANFSAPPVTIAPPDSWRVGARVYAIGNPRGLETTISDGLLSGIRRSEQNSFEALQITVPISSGSSGGGLFDARGRLIGITTFMLRDAQNLNFALPANWIAEVPERAQAALAKRQAQASTAAAPGAAAAAAPTGDRVFEYRLRDRRTGVAQAIVYRLDRVDGDRLVFNQGNRVERTGGAVLENKQPSAGDFDAAMPPGGWVSAPPEPGARWSLRYTNRQLDRTLQLELTARTGETSSFQVAGRELQIVRVGFDGYVQRSATSMPTSGTFKANAWYAPEIGRVVRFDVRSRGGNGLAQFDIDEVVELVDIRSE
ncbi:S1C family serine protease [Hydrogenophaga crocea]|uniref:Serine protease n=1 Tax=Hydrogenophaga crocea TaxID=2716225 RepID=A0A6G8IJF3_9BURK|nr:S1C family serine protease [Hydrogenophaga crocea]QIM53324.1 serine protease [Hydrogenophaga crocea]